MKLQPSQKPISEFKNTKTRSHNFSFPKLDKCCFLDNLATNIVKPNAVQSMAHCDTFSLFNRAMYIAIDR